MSTLNVTTIQDSAAAFEHARLVQVVNVQDGEVATGTTVLPGETDNTIPQNNEGDQYMSLAITPTHASNKLLIEVVANLSHPTSLSMLTAALFQDSTAGALAAAQGWESTAGAVNINVVFAHYMTAGTTSSTTFKVRGGCEDAGTVSFNGSSGTRQLGGVMASSITISEIRV
tara:strand:+ start:216 stop:731 length:516 start_codon:yes stop_codon:yes gene_type:complete